MTAADYPSLDTLLTTVTPVDDEPFDIAGVVKGLRYGSHRDSASALGEIARHVNAERVRTEDARRWVDRLQGECAAKDAAIADALRWLDMAATYATSEDVAAAIDDARAALRATLRHVAADDAAAALRAVTT